MFGILPRFAERNKSVGETIPCWRLGSSKNCPSYHRKLEFWVFEKDSEANFVQTLAESQEDPWFNQGYPGKEARALSFLHGKPIPRAIRHFLHVFCLFFCGMSSTRSNIQHRNMMHLFWKANTFSQEGTWRSLIEPTFITTIVEWFSYGLLLVRHFSRSNSEGICFSQQHTDLFDALTPPTWCIRVLARIPNPQNPASANQIMHYINNEDATVRFQSAFHCHRTWPFPANMCVVFICKNVSWSWVSLAHKLYRESAESLQPRWWRTGFCSAGHDAQKTTGWRSVSGTLAG